MKETDFPQSQQPLPPITLHLGVGPRGVVPVPVSMSTSVVIMIVSFIIAHGAFPLCI